MFRRKDENDASAPATAAMSNGANGASHAHENGMMSAASAAQQASSHASQAPAAAAPASSYSAPAHSAPAQSVYSPATLAANRPATETASRPVASANASYRPAALSEFTRSPAAPRSAEASRPAASASSVSSFASITEKSASIKPNRRVLTVGNDILLKGEIATCDRLVIEGRVEAKLSDVHTVEIAECGSFKGTAEVEDAEISGVFEGDLVVRNRLVIYATGEVRGNIGYGEIEIERGGKLTGQIKTVAANAQAAAKMKALDTSAADKARPAKEAVAA